MSPFDLEPPPLVHSVPEVSILGALDAPNPSADDPAWDLIEAAVDLIAGHYKLDRDEVWVAVIELELEVLGDTGFSNFGHLLEVPWGFSTLGIRVAQKLLGEEEACRPSLLLSYH